MEAWAKHFFKIKLFYDLGDWFMNTNAMTKVIKLVYEFFDLIS